MNDRDHGVVVLGTRWHDRNAELTYVTRSIAAAASRWASVSVLTPGTGPNEADGAFDVERIGERGGYRWPDSLRSDCAVVVDDLTPETVALLSEVGARNVSYVATHVEEHDPSWQLLDLVRDGRSNPFLNVYVPVNELAAVHRHNGFGFTDYQLVLSGRKGDPELPPAAVAWLTAAFHTSNVIVIDNAVASAWRGRALRGRASVDSRMDLWRLIAHASVCIDLTPGRHIARECVEALRFGTPIVVPAGSGPGAIHAAASGGSIFTDPEELLRAVAALEQPGARSSASCTGRRYADATYGDPSALTASLRGILFGA